MHSKTLYLPLHTFEAKEHQKIAMDLWKKIKYFMLDKNKIDKQSNLDPMIVAQQILDTALANPAVHDEVYAQVVKQLCNNPSKFVFPILSTFLLTYLIIIIIIYE